MNDIICLIPVYNDWDAAHILIAEMRQHAQAKNFPNFLFLLVNDGSTEPPPAQLPDTDVKLLHLNRNIGHQKALTTGLAYIHKNIPCHRVLIMDADGEDQPADAFTLLATSYTSNKIVLAHRSSRQDQFWFQFFYYSYKWLFKALTGKKIAYGNFLVLSKPALDKLVYYSEIWNNLPAAILKSGLPYLSIATKKGHRFAGHSKMNFQSLVLHGLGAIAVFIDIIVSRLLLFSVALILISIIGALIILFIRGFTTLAIPGWASTILSSLFIVLLQSFLLSLFTIFLYLSSKSQRQFIPAHHYSDYISTFEQLQS